MSVATSTYGHYEEDDWEKEMEHLVTEDDTPLDNRFSERQQRLLPAILFASWPQGKPFEALSNVGLFYSLHNEPPVAPDFMLSLGVEPRPVSPKKVDRSYMTWIYGKVPDLVVEVVSNLKGGELDRKMQIYAKLRILYYAVHDPFLLLGNRELRLLKLEGVNYVDMISADFMPEIGLGLRVWEGSIDDIDGRWLRFIDQEGRLLPTAEERLELAEENAASLRREKQLAEEMAKQEKLKSERLRQKLLELGLDPDAVN